MPSAADKAWITQINGEDIHPIKAEKIEQDNVKFNRASVSEASKPYIGSNVTYTIFWLISDDVCTAETDQIKIIEKGNKGKGKGKGGNNNTPPPPTTDLPPVLQRVIEVTYTYNAENQLTTETITPEGSTTPTGTLAYAYDNNGNLIEKDDSEEGITTYTYDYENRLVTITYHDGSSSQYIYDGVGKRIKSIENGEITKFLYDGLNVIIEKDVSDQTIAVYTRGISYGGGIGGIVSKINSASESLYYHYDGIGTVTALTDDTGNVVQEYQYDAYGNMLSSQGNIENSHLFSTKEFSAKSGLIYFGARYYDPMVGRFITKDLYTWGPDDPRLFPRRDISQRIWHGLILATKGEVDSQSLMDPNDSFRQAMRRVILTQAAMFPQKFHRYVYCYNNPVNLIDPFGLDPEDPPWWEDFLNWLREFLKRAPNVVDKNPIPLKAIDPTMHRGLHTIGHRQLDLGLFMDYMGEDTGIIPNQ